MKINRECMYVPLYIYFVYPLSHQARGVCTCDWSSQSTNPCTVVINRHIVRCVRMSSVRRRSSRRPPSRQLPNVLLVVERLEPSLAACSWTPSLYWDRTSDQIQIECVEIQGTQRAKHWMLMHTWARWWDVEGWLWCCHHHLCQRRISRVSWICCFGCHQKWPSPAE